MRRRIEKEAHPHAWNPEFGWKFLRLVGSYREAVEQFHASARRSQDKNALFLFDVLAGRRTSQEVSDYIDGLEKPNSRKDAMQRWEITGLADIIFSHGLVPLEKDNLTLAMDASTPHFQKFLARYGDIIRFPIHPDSESPPADYLNAVWNLRPAIFAGRKFIEIQDEVSASRIEPNFGKRMKALVLAINTNFSKDRVLAEVGRYLDQLYRDISDTRDLRPRWDDFEDYVRVLSMMLQKDGDGKSFGLRRIGNALAPKECDASEKKLEWAKERVAYIKRTLLPLFERP